MNLNHKLCIAAEDVRIFIPILRLSPMERIHRIMSRHPRHRRLMSISMLELIAVNIRRKSGSRGAYRKATAPPVYSQMVHGVLFDNLSIG